jgi:branched-chain amino acid transport system permease protein
MIYATNLLIMLIIYVLLGLSLNLLVGHSGLISTAHAAMYGLGAYVTSIVVVHGFASPLISLLAGTICAGLLGGAIGYLSIPLKGDSFVIGTLAVQMVIVSLFRNMKGITGGSYGITGIPRPSLFASTLDSQSSFLFWAAIPLLIVGTVLVILYFTPFTRALRAVRDSEDIAVALGKSLAPLRTQNMALASLAAGFAGGLFALYSSYIDPSSFTFEISIFILMIVIIGGSGNLRGPIAGAMLLLLLPELLRWVPLSQASFPYVRQMLYGISLVLVMRFRPQGLLGSYRFNQ